MLASRIWLGTLALSAVASGATATPVETRGTVDAITVYRGQALVTRVVDVPPAAGLHELVVTDLPEQVVPGSLYAESSGALEVRSVRYRVRPVAADVREEVRKLDEQITAVQDQVRAVERRRQVISDYNGYLGKLEGFVAPTSALEITKGVLSADTLKALSLFLLEQRTRLADEELATAIKLREHQQQLALLDRERQQLTGASARTAREAVVFLSVAGDGGTLRLRYLVNQANWSPSYAVRTDAKRDEARVEYYASIQQMSGEDWGDVAMTLSTATPTLVAKAPVLTPLSVTLMQPQQQQQTAGQFKGGRDELARKQRELESARNAYPADQLGQMLMDKKEASADADAGGRGGGGPGQFGLALDLDRQLNDNAWSIQLLDLTTHGRVVKRPNTSRDIETEGLSVTYQLAARTSLPSRTDQQLVQIAALPLKGEFYRVASPVLTSYVYEEASLTNTSELVLLAGPVATYVNGEFVGHGELPTVISGEQFTVGLGIDSALRATRELVERSESVQGGNRVVEFTYRLSIENFSAQPIRLRTFDRIPTGRDGELKLTLLTGEEDLSQDDTYRKTERRRGLLRWDVEAPARAVAMEAKTIEYKFKLEYDKGMTITGVPLAMNTR
ncbi:MAG: mucoidy inhibitor MuiA family protein [Phycisphaerae bacterium]